MTHRILIDNNPIELTAAGFSYHKHSDDEVWLVVPDRGLAKCRLVGGKIELMVGKSANARAVARVLGLSD